MPNCAFVRNDRFRNIATDEEPNLGVESVTDEISKKHLLPETRTGVPLSATSGHVFLAKLDIAKHLASPTSVEVQLEDAPELQLQLRVRPADGNASGKTNLWQTKRR